MAATGGLQEVSQASFGAGMWRSGAREAVPPNSAYDLTNLLLNDQGLPYKRGGTSFKNNANLPSAPYWVWDGFLAAGQRTVTADSGAGIKVLDTDDQTLVVPGTPPNAGSANPVKPVSVAGVMTAVMQSFAGPYLYGGSKKALDYTTGSAAFTSGSSAVVGTGTSWATNADAGMIFESVGVSGIPVASVEDNTHLTLARPWNGASASGAGYILHIIRQVTTNPAPIGEVYAPVANRLVGRLRGNTTLIFSWANDPWTFEGTNTHNFPAQIIGMAGLSDTLMVFTVAGLYGVFNMAYNLVDAQGNPQQRKQLLNEALIAWTHEGIAQWAGQLIVPCRDGVWLVSPTSAPTPISQAITDLYLSYVHAGYKTGVSTVYEGHYFLPILDASNAWIDTLVCRLIPTRDGGRFGWTHLSGSGGQARSYATRGGSGTMPGQLLSTHPSALRLLRADGYLLPSSSAKTDHDGTAPTVSLTTRDFMAGDQPTFWKRIRAWFEGTVDAGAPTLNATYQRPQDGSASAIYGAASGDNVNYTSPGFTDDFSTNTIANYTFDTGGGTLNVSGGQLVPSSTALKVFYLSTAAQTVFRDGRAILKFTTGATAGGLFEQGVTLRRIGPNDYLFVRHNEFNNKLELCKLDGGGTTVLDSTTATLALSATTSYWVLGQVHGTTLYGELWTSPPTPGGAPALSKGVTLAGADATKYVSGQSGARVVPGGTDWRYDDFSVAVLVSALSDASGYTFFDVQKRGRTVRFTLTTAGALSTWVLHKLTVFFRQQGRQ